jgi:choline dehydrogenase-like flavoprotein
LLFKEGNITENYIFVIIGAGCVLANRLNADGQNSVLILEATDMILK